MFSLNYDIKEFITSLENKNQHERLWVAHQEATEVERRLRMHPLPDDPKKKQMEKYSSDLRSLISSIRYAAVPRKVVDTGWYELFKKGC
jgi:hypothetical protein